mgnify:CR=1 FL=1
MDINITIRFEGLDNLANALSDIAGCRAAVHLAEMTGQKTLPEKKAAPVMECTSVSAKKEREIRDVLKTAAPSDVKAEPKKEAAKPDDTIPREELAGIRQKAAASSRRIRKTARRPSRSGSRSTMRQASARCS